MKSILSTRHPDYMKDSALWKKYRLTFESGDEFITEYLQYFSTRETYADFAARKKVTYCPSYAKAELLKIKNALYQRMSDITRISTLPSYSKATEGLAGGVDRRNATMTGFIGNNVLPELLFMGRVGVYVDREELDAPSLAESRQAIPYLYTYKTEDILSWAHDENNNLIKVLLQDHDYTYDEDGLVDGKEYTYRYLSLEANGVVVKLYKGSELQSEYTLDLDTLPFVIFELSESLLVDVANYQIALLNMASSDVSYTLRSNYPFYTEQYDPRADFASQLRGPAYDENGTAYTPGSEAEAEASKENDVKVGVNTGRRYPKGLERPQFVHPSAEPLKASMEKQKDLQQEIRDLVHLTLSTIESTSAGAVINSGMANISMELEQGERQIARIWSAYEGERDDIIIKYPHSFALKTEEQRQAEAKELVNHIAETPSTTLKKELAKKVADILISQDVSQDILDKVHEEIDNAQVIVLDPDIIKADHEAGFVSTELASTLRGYPAGQVEQAKIDHAERIERIALAQSSASEANLNSARGVSDMDDGSNLAGRQEKELSRQTDEDSTATDKTRGAQKEGEDA